MSTSPSRDGRNALNVGSGLTTFAVMAVVLIAMSLVRFQPAQGNGPKLASRVALPSSAKDLEELAAAGQLDDATLAQLADQGLIDANTAARLKQSNAAGAGSNLAAGAPGSAGTGGSGGTQGSAGKGGGKSGGGVGIGGGGGGSGPGSGNDGGGGGGAIECSGGKNGGATAPGVTGTEIRLASTAALDGPAKSLLAPSVTSMKAIFDKVNQAGGICGRRLVLRVDNDSFDSNRGQQLIRNYIDGGDVFALPVVPSAEGLGASIESGVIKSAGMPVIGSDGLRREQYGDPWVWPVATSTTSTMRVIAKRASDKGAHTFALVYDDRYQFGKEGKDAFLAQVGALSGSVVTTVALNPGDPSYGSQAADFNTKCGGGACDAVVMLLLPDTASKWVKAKPELGKIYTAGAQTLFTDDFARSCVRELGDRCGGFEVFTGYNPPIGALAAKPGVNTFVNDVRAKDPGIDVNNQFVQGAYLGASLFVQALQDTGPNLTRARLQAVLDAKTYTSDLSSTLTWSAGNHRANARSQSFALSVSQGTFQGWGTGSGAFIADPNPGAG